jgi:hypothetical protein
VAFNKEGLWNHEFLTGTYTPKNYLWERKEVVDVKVILGAARDKSRLMTNTK